ncbi:hypothetical protein SprV_0501785400 [Sparganum proliferum]
MRSFARTFANWSGIDGDIDDLARRCSRCQQAAKMPPRQPPVPWQPPERPWSRVHIDFAGPLNGVSYLILVDAYSKWPEIAPLNPATASATFAFLRRIFSHHGLPEVLVSDNSSQFTSSTFEDFCRQHNIQHLRSPPYHPPSNGQAERSVDTFKRALLKTRGERTTDGIVQAFLFSYRTTSNPASPGGVSPAEALMGRKLRTTFHAVVPTGAQPAQTSPVSRSKLSIGTPVFVRDYRTGFPDWVEAAAVAHRGIMLFDVDVGDDIWVRHHSQIRRRHCSNTTGLESAPSLPLDILLDTFAFPADRSVPETTAAPPSDIPPSVSVNVPVSPDNKPRLRRRTNRVRRSTGLMQVNPRQKRFGPRFVALSRAYAKELRDIAKSAGASLNPPVDLQEGVYLQVSGPCFETIAEAKLFRSFGSDLVGMSTANEVVTAVHAGLEVLAISLITNKVVVDELSTEEVSHEEVLAVGEERLEAMERLIAEIIKHLP